MNAPTRRRKKAPSYCLHKRSGQAYVTLRGQQHFLGKYDSDESRQKYARLIADHWAKPDEPPKPIPNNIEAQEVPLKLLAVEYTKYAQQYYVKNGKLTTEAATVRVTMKYLCNVYGDLLASEFGPIRFQNFQKWLIDKGLRRSTVVHYLGHVRRMFRKAAADERIPHDWYLRIAAVENVQPGRMGVKQSKDILPVEDEVVDATCEQLTPILADMVRIQKLTGMRPGELVQLRPRDIDRSQDVWTYEPESHKNQHKKNYKARARVVVLGPQAQEILRPYLLRDHNDYCFQPAEVYAQHQQLRHENRQTPLNHGNRPRPHQPPTFCARYDTNAYRTAIQRAARRAHKKAVENETADHTDFNQSKFKWSPNQLRHSTATLARKLSGLETAQVICGHTQSRTTEEYYAEIDLSLAVEFAARHG